MNNVEVIRASIFLASLPFTRCLRCNASLQEITKADIIEELEPLTKIYYEQFRRCTGCGNLLAWIAFPETQKRLKNSCECWRLSGKIARSSSRLDGISFYYLRSKNEIRDLP